jgi:hypothetical protein
MIINPIIEATRSPKINLKGRAIKVVLAESFGVPSPK